MSTYAVPAFAGQPDAAIRLIRAHPFATLVTSVDGEEPQLSHVPMLYEETGGQGALLGHLARANPQWQRFASGRTLAVFHGPHAYISPTWYAVPSVNVPTWNYAVVHVHGCPQLISEEESRAHLLHLTHHFEGDRFVPDAARVAAMLRGIVGFRMRIERIDAKFKMSQNKGDQDRRGVITGLRATGLGEALATAQWLEAHEPR